MKPFCAAVLAAGLFAPPAFADVIFDFTQTGSTPPGVVTASGSLSLSDAAFADGINVSRRAGPPAGVGPLVALTGTGITALSFAVRATPVASGPGGVSIGLAAGFADFTSLANVSWSVDLTSLPSGAPAGTIRFNDLSSDFVFNLAGSASSGSFNTDGPNPCNRTGTCGFTGAFGSASGPGAGSTAVPEPASLALLGGAVGALGAVGGLGKRRRGG